MLHKENEILCCQTIEHGGVRFCLEEYWEEDDAGYCVSDYILAKHTRVAAYDTAGQLLRRYDLDSREYEKQMWEKSDMLFVRWHPEYDREHVTRIDMNTLEPLSCNLIAFDMDGTLLDSRKQVRTDSREAIAAAATAGKTILLATGRALPELAEFLPQLPDIAYVVGSSGGFVRDVRKGKNLFTSCISPEMVLAMLKRTREVPVMVQLYSEKSYLPQDKARNAAKYSMGAFQDTFDRTATKVPDMEAFYREHPVPIYKLNLYCQSPAQRESLRDIFADLPLSMAYSEIASLEFSRKGTSKASGIRWLCRYLGIPISHTIAVGDGGNDHAMMQLAGLSVAMGNADPATKELADIVTADNDSGGCAQIIREYLLNRANPV